MGKMSIKKILPGARQSQQLAWRNDGDQVIGGSTRVHDVFVGTFVAVPVANIRVQHPSLVLGRSLDQGPPLAPQPPPGTGCLPPTSAAGFRRAGGVPVRPQGTGIPGGSNQGRQPVPPPDERDDSTLWPLFAAIAARWWLDSKKAEAGSRYFGRGSGRSHGIDGTAMGEVPKTWPRSMGRDYESDASPP